MKAIVSHRYGPPEVLQLREVDKPTLTDDGVLVRVRACSVVGDPSEWYSVVGKPYLVRGTIMLEAQDRRPLATLAETVL